jgi:hypothetical protein
MEANTKSQPFYERCRPTTRPPFGFGPKARSRKQTVVGGDQTKDRAPVNSIHHSDVALVDATVSQYGSTILVLSTVADGYEEGIKQLAGSLAARRG